MIDPDIEATARYYALGDGIFRESWVDQARQGRIWFPWSVTDRWAQILCMWLTHHAVTPSIEVFIDTADGKMDSFRPCYWLLRRRERNLQTLVTVVGQAASIGLSYTVCGTHRLALPEAKFTLHGEMGRWGAKHESGVDLEDHYAADWMARFTGRRYGFWMGIVSRQKVCEFGVAEALEWGVIDEVLPGV